MASKAEELDQSVLEYFRAGFAEFLGTFLFVLFGVGGVCALNATNPLSELTPLNYALSFGLCITILLFAMGGVSGGHLNPAVSLTMLITGNVDIIRFVVYVVAQILGGVCGGGFLRLMVQGTNTITDASNNTFSYQIYSGGLTLNPASTPIQGFFIEVVGTFLLLYVVYNVAIWIIPTQSRIQDDLISSLAPLPIGFSVSVAHLFAGPFTGCGINPARALGTSVWEDEEFWKSDTGKHFWIYIFGPILAAILLPLVQWVQFGHMRPAAHNTDPRDTDSTIPTDPAPTMSATNNNFTMQRTNSTARDVVSSWETNSLPATSFANQTVYKRSPRPITQPTSLQSNPESLL